MLSKRSKRNKQRAAAWREQFRAWWSRMLRNYPRHRLGRKGERVAARFLREQGYRVLCRNLRYRYGELDLVVIRGEVVVFVEVRTRRSGTHADLYRSIDRAKQQRLYRAARAVVKQYRLSSYHLRFDIITILWPEGSKPDIQHHQNAFVPGSSTL